jgi:hypothetical protein
MLRILSIAALAAVLLAPVPASAFTIGFGPFRLSIGVGPSYRHALRPSVRHVRRATRERVATSRPRPDREAPPARASEPTTMGGGS